MAFQKKFSAGNYQSCLAADQSEGVCAGMCGQWLLDIFQGEVHEVLPPPYSNGARLHAAYEAEFKMLFRASKTVMETMISSELLRERYGGSQSYPVEHKQYTDEASINQVVSDFSIFPGNSGLYMRFYFFANRWAEPSGHVLALFRNKENGKIFLYDPNCGVYEWVRGSPGEKLHEALSDYAMSTQLGVSFIIYSVFLLRTHQTLPVNEILTRL